MSAYHAESIVSTLAAAVAADPSVVAKVYSQQLRKGARSVDDFSMFEGAEGSGKPFIVRKDIATAHAGDEVKFTVMSQPRGPGARGEQPLRGNESQVDFKTFGCVVDFWRDAFKFTKKQVKFMAGGGGVKSAVSSRPVPPPGTACRQCAARDPPVLRSRPRPQLPHRDVIAGQSLATPEGLTSRLA